MPLMKWMIKRAKQPTRAATGSRLYFFLISRHNIFGPHAFQQIQDHRIGLYHAKDGVIRRLTHSEHVDLLDGSDQRLATLYGDLYEIRIRLQRVKIKECEFATDDGIIFVTAAARSDNHIVLIAGVLLSVAYIVRLTC